MGTPTREYNPAEVVVAFVHCPSIHFSYDNGWMDTHPPLTTGYPQSIALGYSDTHTYQEDYIYILYSLIYVIITMLCCCFVANHREKQQSNKKHTIR